METPILSGFFFLASVSNVKRRDSWILKSLLTIAWRIRERELLTPGSSQRLDLFKKVLCVLCPNLPDAFIMLEEGHRETLDIEILLAAQLSCLLTAANKEGLADPKKIKIQIVGSARRVLHLDA